MNTYVQAKILDAELNRDIARDRLVDELTQVMNRAKRALENMSKDSRAIPDYVPRECEGLRDILHLREEQLRAMKKLGELIP